LDNASWETGRLRRSPISNRLSDFAAARQRMLSRACPKFSHALGCPVATGADGRGGAICVILKQFGRPVFDFQAIQFMLADMSAEIDVARLLMWKVAWRRDSGLPFSKESSHAKLSAGDTCVVNAMQVSGGAHSKEYPIERYYRDAKIHEI